MAKSPKNYVKDPAYVSLAEKFKKETKEIGVKRTQQNDKKV